MTNLNKFYDDYYKNTKISWPFIIGILLFSFFIYYIFSKYELKDIFEFIKNFSAEYKNLSYFIAFIAAIVEGTIILSIAPGTITILVFGAVAASGTLSFLVLIPIIILGAVLGDNLGYFLGTRFGKKVLKTGLVDPLQYRMAEKFLDDHGGKSIALSRFINGMKELTPFIAGTINMNKKKFLVFNFLGAIGWAFLWLGLGYIFYENLIWISNNIEKVLTGISLIFLFFAVRYYKKHKNELLKS